MLAVEIILIINISLIVEALACGTIEVSYKLQMQTKDLCWNSLN